MFKNPSFLFDILCTVVWLVIGELNMTEQEAHRYIDKQAMDRCVTKRAVAEQILSTYK